MAFRYASTSSLIAAALLAGAPSSAPAQCRLCSSPTTGLDTGTGMQAIELEVATSLDFDRLILLGAGQGAAILHPSGERSAAGNLATVSARAMVGEVTIRGEPGRTVQVEMPRRIDLHSLSGGRIEIDEIRTDLPTLPKLDSAGNLSFRFGGQLNVTGDSEGEYRGDVPITVDYL